MSQLFVPSSPHSRAPSQTTSVLFAASTSHVAHLAEILHSLASIDRYALITVSKDGLAFFSEHNHILNASATIDASLFSTYEFVAPSDTENVLLGVDVIFLGELFAAAAATTVAPKAKPPAGLGPAPQVNSVVCYIKYEGEGRPLIVEFEDRLLVELIEFATFELDFENPFLKQNEPDGDDYALIANSARLRFEVIILSDIFLNMLQDLQALGTEELYMYVSNLEDGELLHFISKCGLGYLKLIYPSAKTMLQKLEVYEEDTEPTSSIVVSVLNFHVFIRMLRAVKQSIKCKLVKDGEGVLAAQLLCKNVNCAGYPGTMMTFNMLEKVTLPTDPSAIEVARLFDDGGCQYIKEYTVPSKISLAVKSTAPPALMNTADLSGISYASFRTSEGRDTMSGAEPASLSQLFF